MIKYECSVCAGAGYVVDGIYTKYPRVRLCDFCDLGIRTHFSWKRNLVEAFLDDVFDRIHRRS